MNNIDTNYVQLVESIKKVSSLKLLLAALLLSFSVTSIFPAKSSAGECIGCSTAFVDAVDLTTTPSGDQSAYHVKLFYSKKDSPAHAVQLNSFRIENKFSDFADYQINKVVAVDDNLQPSPDLRISAHNSGNVSVEAYTGNLYRIFTSPNNAKTTARRLTVDIFYTWKWIDGRTFNETARAQIFMWN